MHKRVIELLLKLAEKIIPDGYYVQGAPAFLNLEDCNLIDDYPREGSEFSASLHGNVYKPMRDTNRWLLLRLGLVMASQLNDGDYVELGTYQGASAKIIYKHMSKESSLYCFDTFEGFASEDINIEKSKTGVLVSIEDFAKTSTQVVEKFICDKASNHRLVLCKGIFPDTFKYVECKKLRFVHLDCDLYEPMRNGLQLFWPMMVKGGILIVHDYNSGFKGVKAAVDEFSAREGVVVIPWIDQCGSVLIVKH